MKVVIDRKSCAPEPVYNYVKNAFETAQRLAGGASDVWQPWADAKPFPQEAAFPRPTEVYQNLAAWLAGRDTPRMLRRTIRIIGRMTLLTLVDRDIDSPYWKAGEADQQDLASSLLLSRYPECLLCSALPLTYSNPCFIIVCNANHIEKAHHDEPNTNNVDTIQNLPVLDGRLVLKIRDGTADSRVMAATSAKTEPMEQDPEGNWIDDWDPKKPEVIVINPQYLRSLQEKGFPRYNDDLINHARLDTARKAAERAAGVEIQASIDLLNTLEITLLHEISHLGTMNWAEDVDDDCYTWDNAVRLQTCTNAENVALFVVATDLTKNHNLKVTKSGMIEPI
ncbi:hypothetical protein PG996_014375 [Apiospora saccharicola]|uniref:Uncharacterized protein n=1 Tax=Apiospora saccharicola TaxID=335842 RepID=A0ABR1TK50_9PEZI